MKLARFQLDGLVSLGLVEHDEVRPIGGDYGAIRDVLGDPSGAERSAGAAAPLRLTAVTLLPPVDEGARVFAVAQNYQAHAQEVSGMEAPPAPLIFLKSRSALIGAGERIELPPITHFLDYEAEVAVVVGKTARRVDEKAAADTVFGVTCFNDVTGRDLQAAILGGKEVIDWFSAKSLDRSSPIGPWIVSLDELEGDLTDLGVRCRLNGETVQDDRSSSMVTSIQRLLSFISHRVALQPGDVIATGTPGGVGRARGIKLGEGDIVEVEVEGVGVLRNEVAVVS